MFSPTRFIPDWICVLLTSIFVDPAGAVDPALPMEDEEEEVDEEAAGVEKVYVDRFEPPEYHGSYVYCVPGVNPDS